MDVLMLLCWGVGVLVVFLSMIMMLVDNFIDVIYFVDIISQIFWTVSLRELINFQIIMNVLQTKSCMFLIEIECSILCQQALEHIRLVVVYCNMPQNQYIPV